ncbi:DUF3307 domain-containing protein [Yoonia sp. F2084L]|uniref:DUF3307 domain-containing protein n=1 Tax=Yoonia sp. F2084L TaxID=2926419 RepID=UPI001FF2BC2D|nr:DUF3307 domain-containing protein [Yoonia sp. F2084L]MCK0094791.1 DUF3307 domain-containing protein [Yoonia sp. F2084L]
MLTTALALLLAHVLADYPLQNSWIIANKKKPAAMAAHIGVVFLLTLIALGGEIMPALTIAALHLCIDLIKTHLAPDRLWAYIADQLAHFATIAGVLWFWPELGALWPDATIWAQYLMAITVGTILCVYAGGPAVGLLMQDFDTMPQQGLPEAGRMIGLLERALIFLMVMAGQPGGIGFLIAAKSVLRFDTASKDQKAGEYVIIGTLASFGWALLVSFATLSLITFYGLDPTPS